MEASLSSGRVVTAELRRSEYRSGEHTAALDEDHRSDGTPKADPPEGTAARAEVS